MINLRALAFLCAFAAFSAHMTPALARGLYAPEPVELSYSDFLGRAAAKELREVTIRGHLAYGETTDGSEFRTYLPPHAGTVDRLLAKGIRIKAEPADSGSGFGCILNLVPALLLPVLLLWFHSDAGSRNSDGLRAEFRRARLKEACPSTQRVSFAEVAGVDEAREALEEIVQFLREPLRFEALGGRLPAGVLLTGPPGTGKTLLARAIAGEAEVPFFSISGSDFVEMFVGIGAARVRDTFARAREHAPCIVFIDEIDAIGRRRGAGVGNQNDEREQALNQLLVEMDGIEGPRGVILIAATNRADILDPALLRPGRFDRQVIVPLPDAAGRERILSLHLRKIEKDAAIDVPALARSTPGFSGAELANLVNEAALLAARRGRACVGTPEIDDARDKVMMGPIRRSLALTPEERRRMAYHQAGHALVAIAMPENGRLVKVTIAPRGRTLDLTYLAPQDGYRGVSRADMRARITMLLGGRVAEELIGGDKGVTTGAANDLQQATALARRFVTEFGFSDLLGPVSCAAGTAQPSEATAELIDVEIRRVVEEGVATARNVLSARLDVLDRAASMLLEHESLSGEAFAGLLNSDRKTWE